VVSFKPPVHELLHFLKVYVSTDPPSTPSFFPIPASSGPIPRDLIPPTSPV
jgi:hypothetical protein